MQCILKTFKTLNKSYCTKTNLQIQPFLEQWRNKFKSAEIENFDFDLKCMIGHILKKNFASITDLEEINFTQKQLKTLDRLCECRLARVPIQYILGEWDFRNLNLKMQPTVFIPRPETEGLVELVIQNLDHEKSLKFLEIGSGTGAIILSILNAQKNAIGTAIDRSKIACTLTMENAVNLELQNRIKVIHHAVTADKILSDELKNEKFNIIVSNPPYIRSGDLNSLSPEIKLYENLNALDGGSDGLKIIKLLIELASLHLVEDGKLWMELDPSHPSIVKEIIDVIYSKKLKYISSYKDIFNNTRYVEIVKI